MYLQDMVQGICQPQLHGASSVTAWTADADSDGPSPVALAEAVEP